MGVEALVIAILSSGAFSAVVSALVAFISNKMKKRSGVEHGTQILLCKALKEDCRRFIAQGFISFDDHEELTEAYQCYKTELSGNGYLEKLIGEVDKLPKKED